MQTHPYDHRLNRRLTAEDLPDDISLETLAAFLEAKFATFYCLDTIGSAVRGRSSAWIRDPDLFRIGTSQFPVRGIVTSWALVRAWKAERPEVDRMVRLLENTCVKLGVAVRDAEPVTLTPEEAQLLFDVVMTLKREVG